MKQISATRAQREFVKLIDQAAETHKPIYIKGERNNAVLVSGDDWRAIEETIYLLSIPTMRASTIEGINAPLEDCLTEEEFYAKLN